MLFNQNIFSMKNFKFLAVAIVVLVAGSAFAFFNNEAKPVKKVLVTQTYYHINDEYVPLASPPTGRSCKTDDFNCTITLNGSNLPGKFDEDQIPSNNSNYTVSPSPEMGSWQP